LIGAATAVARVYPDNFFDDSVGVGRWRGMTYKQSCALPFVQTNQAWNVCYDCSAYFDTID
jgi:hypothetical protein